MNEHKSDILSMKIGKTIKKIRKEQKLSQKELSELSGVGYSTIRLMERLKYAGTSVQTLEKITNALNVSLPLFFLRVLEEDKEPGSSNSQEYTAYHQAVFDSMYPPPLFGYKAHSLLQFLVYLPLLDFSDLLEILSFVEGSFMWREEMLLSYITCKISTIPPSKAKDYADKIAEDIAMQRDKKTLGPDLNDESDRDAQFLENKAAYQAKIQEKQDFLNSIKKLAELFAPRESA